MQAVLIAGTLIERDNKYLLINAKVGTPKGLWNLPAGHVDEGEMFDEAAVREAKEETGYDVELGEIIAIGHQTLPDRESVFVMFSAKIIGGELSLPEDEIEKAQWFTREEIGRMHNKDMTHMVSNALESVSKGKQLIYRTDRTTA